MANWPTHKARQPARKARHRWALRRLKRERQGVTPQKAKTRDDKDTAPISDWTWAAVHRSSTR